MMDNAFPATGPSFTGTNGAIRARTRNNYCIEGAYYKTRLCTFYHLHKFCARGESCGFVHHRNELRDLPQQIRKTRLCDDFATGHCIMTREECPFAHGRNDCKPPQRVKKCPLPILVQQRLQHLARLNSGVDCEDLRALWKKLYRSDLELSRYGFATVASALAVIPDIQVEGLNSTHAFVYYAPSTPASPASPASAMVSPNSSSSVCTSCADSAVIKSDNGGSSVRKSAGCSCVGNDTGIWRNRSTIAGSASSSLTVSTWSSKLLCSSSCASSLASSCSRFLFPSAFSSESSTTSTAHPAAIPSLLSSTFSSSCRRDTQLLPVWSFSLPSPFRVSEEQLLEASHDLVCSVCMCFVAHHPRVGVCGHAFCADCIENWLKQHNKRTDVRPWVEVAKKAKDCKKQIVYKYSNAYI